MNMSDFVEMSDTKTPAAKPSGPVDCKIGSLHCVYNNALQHSEPCHCLYLLVAIYWNSSMYYL